MMVASNITEPHTVPIANITNKLLYGSIVTVLPINPAKSD